jgi:hypothetical protein
MGLIQARSTRIRLRGYPDRVPGKAEDHWAAVRVRDRAVRQAIVAVRVQVEEAHPVEVALQVVVPDREAAAVSDNTMKKMLFVMQTRR